MPNVVNFELHTAAAIPERLVAQSRANAEAVGYANGWAVGLREVHSRHAGEWAEAERRVAAAAHRYAEALQASTAALHFAAFELEERSVASYDELADVILAAAMDIAEALLGCELSDPRVAATSALKRVMNMVPENETVTVRLNPSDHAALTSAYELVELPHNDRTIVLQIDESLESGDSVAVSGATTVDGRLSESVRRLKEHLAR